MKKKIVTLIVHIFLKSQDIQTWSTFMRFIWR